MNILFYYRNRESLGIEYLSAILKNAGHKVDLLFDPGLDNTFYYKNNLLKCFSNEKKLINKAKEFKPDLLAFSITASEYANTSLMAKKLKDIFHVPTIVGGIHPTAVPEFVIQDPNFDMLCRGEGEIAFPELVRRMASEEDIYSTPNIWFKKTDGTIVRNEIGQLVENLDSLPWPDKDLFYKYGCFKDLVMIISGRGCPYNCSYCHNNLFKKEYQGKGQFVRRRSVKNVIEELKFYKSKYKLKKVNFEDDLFVKDVQWLEEFSEIYPKEINIPFCCFAFATHINENTLKLLKKAGCINIFMGIDSADETLSKNILKRNTPNDIIINSIKLIKKYDIPIELSAIFGWPHETEKQMWEGVKFVEALEPNQVQAQVLHPYAGTDIFDYCKEKGLIGPKTIEGIYKGETGMLDVSVLKQPNGDLAYVLSKLLPLYIKSPKIFRPLIKKMMHPKIKKYANLIFVATIPIIYWHFYFRIREFIRMAIFSLRKGTYK